MFTFSSFFTRARNSLYSNCSVESGETKDSEDKFLVDSSKRISVISNKEEDLIHEAVAKVQEHVGSKKLIRPEPELFFPPPPDSTPPEEPRRIKSVRFSLTEDQKESSIEYPDSEVIENKYQKESSARDSGFIENLSAKDMFSKDPESIQDNSHIKSSSKDNKPVKNKSHRINILSPKFLPIPCLNLKKRQKPTTTSNVFSVREVIESDESGFDEHCSENTSDDSFVTAPETPDSGNWPEDFRTKIAEKQRELLSKVSFTRLFISYDHYPKLLSFRFLSP